MSCFRWRRSKTEWNFENENYRLRQALREVRAILTVPAAEYVPAIPDAWAVIDNALQTHRITKQPGGKR